MRYPSFENAKWYALVAGLAGILILLAALQYKSSKQISQATTEQMLANLGGTLMNLRQGLEGELTPLCRELEQNEADSRGISSPDYSRRLERWRRAAAHPELVTGVYIWQPAHDQSAGFFRLGLQSNEFESVDWPANLTQLRQRLEEMTPKDEGPRSYPPDHAGPHGPRLGPAFPPPPGGPAPYSIEAPPSFGWMIDEKVPVLVHPVFEAELGGERNKKRGSSPAWVLVTLNLDLLRGHIFPELVQRYFGAEDRRNYEIAVINENPDARAVIYSSDPAFGEKPGVAPDAALNLFGRPIPIVGRERFPIQKVFPPAGDLRAEETGRRAEPRLPTSAQQDPEPFRIEPILYAPNDEGWEIVAQHRKGSVDAAVTSLFHRNLAFNFAVLLVLAATMGMIGVNSRRARRLAQLQMDFVASVSHELRTPLTGIVSAAQNISDGIVDDKSRVARYGNVILSQAHQLTELIEQILLFSATGNDRHRYHLQPASVDELVETSLSNTSALIRSTGVTVERQIQPNLPPVMVDFKAFSQCLQNLITNAVKYGGEQRWLGIRAGMQESGAHGNEIQIAVEDRGIGIEADDLKHIFEPFFRSPVVTAAQIHGSGLGLPLAKTIAEAMGGRLTIKSVPQKGSIFTVHLPVVNPGEKTNGL
jgi:two-component system, OmpR family, sensor histidine kinase SenX3